METEEAPKSTVLPDEATIAKTTREVLTNDAEIVAAYGAETLTVRVLLTAVACRLGVTDAARANAILLPTVKATLMDYMAEHNQAINNQAISLRKACAAGDLDAIRQLLDGGCDINELGIDEQTPLYHACDNGQIEAARLLLHRGADVELSGKDYPPLLRACAEGCYGVACLLIFVGRANVNRVGVKFTRQLTPLLVASVNGHPVIAKLLIDRGADVNWAEDRKKKLTALILACHKGHTDVVRVLIDRGGADINAVGSDGRTPFFVACSAGHYDVVELLMKKGAITDTEFEGSTLPLESAITQGHIAVAELLRPGIMEALRALKAAEGKFSTLSAEHLAALAPIIAAGRAAAKAEVLRLGEEAARPAP